MSLQAQAGIAVCTSWWFLQMAYGSW